MRSEKLKMLSHPSASPKCLRPESQSRRRPGGDSLMRKHSQQREFEGKIGRNNNSSRILASRDANLSSAPKEWQRWVVGGIDVSDNELF